LSEHARIAERIAEGEQKRNKLNSLEEMLSSKIASVRYPMQELELNYPTTKGKIYSEEEDRYLLCRLHYYGIKTEDVYERIKKDILEFPVFRFDWFFKSRTPQELQRRCNTLLGLIEKEVEQEAQEERARSGGTKGRKRQLEEDTANEDEKKEKPEKKERKSGKATAASSKAASRVASPTPAASTTGSAAGSTGGAKKSNKKKKI
jgi:SWI/SNF-related matrix-associated actin-dependent regulator of chromatin subfamily A member 5